MLGICRAKKDCFINRLSYQKHLARFAKQLFKSHFWKHYHPWYDLQAMVWALGRKPAFSSHSTSEVMVCNSMIYKLLLIFILYYPKDIAWWNHILLLFFTILPVVAVAEKNLPANAGDVRDMGLIPGSRRSPGGGHGNPLQYSCRENPMDRRAWRATAHGVAKSQTRLKWLRMHLSQNKTAKSS